MRKEFFNRGDIRHGFVIMDKMPCAGDVGPFQGRHDLERFDDDC